MTGALWVLTQWLTFIAGFVAGAWWVGGRKRTVVLLTLEPRLIPDEADDRQDVAEETWRPA